MEDNSIDTPDSSDPEITEERLARLVRLAARAFNRSLQLRLQAEGVTFGQWIFLRILWYNDGLSQRELSKRANLTEPTTHTALTRLENHGIIVRKQDETNRRRFRSFLTRKGWELRDRLEPMAVEANTRALHGVSSEEERIIRKGLLKIIENLEDDEREAAARGVHVPATRVQ
ncbi:MarR family transcriptional regulator [Aquicoccus sp. SCR17]|nr:MarR family transcriptional regulator [Carideicomes alvinocaridis]